MARASQASREQRFGKPLQPSSGKESRPIAEGAAEEVEEAKAGEEAGAPVRGGVGDGAVAARCEGQAHRSGSRFGGLDCGQRRRPQSAHFHSCSEVAAALLNRILHAQFCSSVANRRCTLNAWIPCGAQIA